MNTPDRVMNKSEFTLVDYDRAYWNACKEEYPMVDVLEQRLGVAVNRDKLDIAARVLACPIKRNPPCWQHGRIIYSVVCSMMNGRSGPWLMLDVGTAKGFSALCMLWAAIYAGYGAETQIVSVDVIDPLARVRRNTVAELKEFLTLPEILAPWPEAGAISFRQSTGTKWLQSGNRRVHFAFLDGKHTYDVVKTELYMLAQRQEQNDVVICDDMQIPGVTQAVTEIGNLYSVHLVPAKPDRIYAIMTRN